MTTLSKAISQGFLAAIFAAAVALPVLADSQGSATGGSAGTQSTLGGCAYQESSATLQNGQQLGLKCDSVGRLLITGSSSGDGGVTSINNSDGTLTLSPNPITADGSISLALGNANTWTGQQTFVAPVLGSATASSLAFGGCTIGGNQLCTTSSASFGSVVSGNSYIASAAGPGFSDSAYSQTGGNSASMIQLTGTLNTTGGPDIIKLSITNTASGANTNFINFYGDSAGTTSKFRVDMSGTVRGTSFVGDGSGLTNLGATALTGVVPTANGGLGVNAGAATGIPWLASGATSFGANTTWTPTDVSGAGLTLTITNATYVRVGSLVFIQCQVLYPTNATVQPAAIGGLPFTANALAYSVIPVSTNAGVGAFVGRVTLGNTNIEILDYQGLGITNTQLSGKILIVSGFYFL